MSFNRPINCHYYNESLFVLGDISRCTLYVIDKDKKHKTIPLINTYQYLYGIESELILFNLKLGNADVFSTKTLKLENKIDIIRNGDMRELIASEDITELIVNYDPHLKLSFGISINSDNLISSYIWNRQACVKKLSRTCQHILMEYSEDTQSYFCEAQQENSINKRWFKYDRNAEEGFRDPTSLCIRGNNFLILDSSNYALKEYDLNSLELKWIIGGKGKELVKFDRCNSLSLSDSDNIFLSDMNNDRILEVKDTDVTMYYGRKFTYENLNRPVSFSKNNQKNFFYIICRDNNSIFQWIKDTCIYVDHYKDKINGSLIGFEKHNDENYYLFRGYDFFKIYQSTSSMNNSPNFIELLSIDGDIQDYDYLDNCLYLLNSSYRSIHKFKLTDKSVYKFSTSDETDKHYSLSKGISHIDQRIMIINFYNGAVSIFNTDGTLSEKFSLPEADDIFRKIIHLHDDYFIVLARKMVRIYKKYENEYIHEFSEYNWSSPTDAILSKGDLFIANKESDRIEIIKNYKQYC